MTGDTLTREDMQRAMDAVSRDFSLQNPTPLAIYADSRYVASWAIHKLAAEMWGVPLIDTKPN